MKKTFILTVVCLLLSSVAVMASPRAIGGRLGYGLEFSYQHGLNSGNMVSIDAGLAGFNGIEVAATHDWLFNISAWDKKGSWNWYAGVGAGLGLGNLVKPADQHNYFFAGVAGRIGAEYNFWFPLQLSLDWRPLIGVSNAGSAWGFNHGGLYQGGLCLGVRYLF